MKKTVCLSLLISLTASGVFQTRIVKAQTVIKEQLVPTVTIPAPPGSKGFDIPQPPKAGGTAPAPQIRELDNSGDKIVLGKRYL